MSASPMTSVHVKSGGKEDYLQLTQRDLGACLIQSHDEGWVWLVLAWTQRSLDQYCAWCSQ